MFGSVWNCLATALLVVPVLTKRMPFAASARSMMSKASGKAEKTTALDPTSDARR